VCVKNFIISPIFILSGTQVSLWSRKS